MSGRRLRADAGRTDEERESMGKVRRSNPITALGNGRFRVTVERNGVRHSRTITGSLEGAKRLYEKMRDETR